MGGSGGGGDVGGNGGGGGGGGFVSSGSNGQNATGAASGSGGTGGGLSGLGSGFGDGGDGGSGGSGGNFGAGGAGGAFGFGGGAPNGGGGAGGGVGGGGGAAGPPGGGGGFAGGGGIGASNGGGGGFGGGGGGFRSNGGVGGGGGFAGGNSGGGGGGMGGAIFNHRGTLTIINTTMTLNTAQGGNGANGGSGFGGAIFNLNGSATITSSTLAANTVTAGTGGSSAQADGGAVYNLAFGNKIEDGSASTATVTISNSILATTSGGTNDLVNDKRDGTQANTATVTFSNGNLVMAKTSINGATESGSPTLSSNPNLGALAVLSNCAAGTCKPAVLPLLANSPAINAASGTSPATDQTGTMRPQGNTPDIGAYELCCTAYAGTLTAPDAVCATSTGNPASITATMGASYAWAIENGTITSATNIASITWTAGTVSPVKLTVVVTDGFGCPTTFNKNVTVNPLPTITLGASPSVLPGITSANLPYTATTGSPNQYSIDYDATANTAGFVDVTNAALPSTPIVLTVPGMASPATYNGTLTVRNVTTSCVSGSVPFTVRILACPTLFTVNDLGDTPDATPGDTICADAGGKCTLRAAIMEANAITPCSPLTIDFSVTGTINLATALPNLNHPNLTIDGPGADQLNVRRNSMTAFRIFTINSGKTVTLDGLTISNGDAGTGFGGGVYSTGTLTITGCAISGNRADNGGGIFQGFAPLIMTNSTVSGNNTTFQASGVNIQDATATLTNCTISGNISQSSQGGIANLLYYRTTSTLALINCTITNNTSVAPFGAVWTDSGNTDPNARVTTTLKNTLVFNNGGGNFATNVDQIALPQFILSSLGNNLDSDGTSGFTNGVNGDIVGTIVNPIVALLAPLGNYGGPTQTHALLPGSPAINAGTSSGAPSADQRGIARVGATDIGAFESRGFSLAINGGNNQSTFVNTAFANPLSVTVSSSFSEPVNGGLVTFTPPGSGASAAIAGNPATIAGGTATTGTVTANGTVGGPYNVAASANGASSGVNFSLTNLNPPPQIMVSGPINRQQGSAAINPVIATVNDANQSAGTLVVTATTVPAGITVTNIVNTNGTITADVAAGCNAAIGDNTVELTVTDIFMASSTGYLTVRVTANTAPTVGNYAATSLLTGGGTTVTPSAAPADNGTIASVTATASPNTFTGSLVGNTMTGAITITNAAPAGNYTITVTVKDNCGAETQQTFSLKVNTPPTIGAVATSRQQGSPSANSTIANVNDVDQAEDTLSVKVNGGTSATINGVTVSNIAVSAAGVVTADVVATCTATNASFTLRVTDSLGDFTETTLNVTVTANTAPTVGTYAATTVPNGGGTTVTPSAAPADNGTIASVTATASPNTFTGSLVGNTTTGAITISNAAPAGNLHDHGDGEGQLRGRDAADVFAQGQHAADDRSGGDEPATRQPVGQLNHSQRQRP
ncbi:MAG: hypothetical protein IPL01_00090 [Acidobacteria bacterium]|nr:hypothetical protein [Acidobacteriota bacterium]